VYEALLLGLRKGRALGANNFLVKFDDEVIKDDIDKEQAMEYRRKFTVECVGHILL
jgi:hypothetical protein